MAGRTTGWKDIFYGLGVVFLIIAVLVFGMLLLQPFGVTTPGSWESVLAPLSGAFGVTLIGIGLFHERRGRG